MDSLIKWIKSITGSLNVRYQMNSYIHKFKQIGSYIISKYKIGSCIKIIQRVAIVQIRVHSQSIADKKENLQKPEFIKT